MCVGDAARRAAVVEEARARHRASADGFLIEDDPALAAAASSPREALPQPQETRGRISARALVSMMAKDGQLAQAAASGLFPAACHEPLSDLQRRAESCFTSAVLDKAAQQPRGSEGRLLLVAAYNIAQWSGLSARVDHRAFRPARQETYELVSQQPRLKALFEQTMHDSAGQRFMASWQVWGGAWSLRAQSAPSAHFKLLPLPKVEYDLGYRAELAFADGDCYQLTMPGGVVTGLARDRQALSYRGSAVVRNALTGDRVEADLREPGRLRDRGGGRRRVRGALFRQGTRVEGLQLGGRWDECIVACRAGAETCEVLWQRPAEQPPADSTYGFSRETLQLNHLPPALAALLPPTDTRRRPDVRALEAGRFDEAEAQQRRIVGLQATASGGAAAAAGAQPRWFEPQQAGSWLSFSYKGGYWEARAARAAGRTAAAAWAGCADAFGLAAEVAVEPQQAAAAGLLDASKL